MDINLDKIEKYISNNLHGSISEVLYKHKCYDLVIRLTNSSYCEKAYIRYLKNKSRVACYFKECQPILSQNEIPYVIVKGTILSQIAYTEPYIRNSNDIDILVAPNNTTAFNRLLKDNGFVQGTICNGEITPVSREKRVYQTFYSHQLLPFIKKTEIASCPLINIDVNTNIFWGESTYKVNMEDLLSNRINISVEGIEVYKLDPISEFIVLCLHHFKDMNSIYLLSQGSLKLRLFIDIYRYIQSQHTVLPINELLKKCERWNALPYVYYCLYQTAYLFPSRILNRYSNALKNSSGDYLLNKFGLADNERKEWQTPLENRLFSSDFLPNFYKMLNDDDIKKINLNIKMMQ
jgi:hypothetical protein